jgi:hypothetical protein
MAAKKITSDETSFKFSIYEGKKWIRIRDILKTTDWGRSSIERKIIDGELVSRKVGVKVYISWDSYQAWSNGNG